MTHNSLNKRNIKVFVIWIFILFCIAASIIIGEVIYSLNHHEKVEEKIDSNTTIMNQIKNEFQENGNKYKKIVTLLSSLTHDGYIRYVVFGTPEKRYKLWGEVKDDYDICLSNKYQKETTILKEICQDSNSLPGSFYFERGRIVFYPCTYLKNNSQRSPYFVFSTKSEQELQNDYNNYLIYDSISDDYKGGWLLRLEPNWYIVSPDSCDKNIY